MHTIPVATMRLGAAVTEAEEAVDQAVLRITRLIGEIVTTRSAHRSHEAAVHAQPALLRAQKALAELNSAQGEIARCHAALRSAHQVTAGPEETSCPDRPEVFTGAELAEAV